MNNKGFTLIELLAVITILSLIAMIVFPAINSVVNKAKEDANNDQIAIIEKAAKQWAVDNVDGLPNDSTAVTSVSVRELIQEGYLENNNMSGEVEITWDDATRQYIYRYTENNNNN